MLYHVSRNGETFGPYTLEDLQRYLASGNILPIDLAKSEDMAEWTPVSQILGAAAPVAAAYPQRGAPAYATAAAVYPDPPNLHWALVLLIGVFTCGLFCIVWDFVQSAWMRRVNPRSNALFLYIAEFVFSILTTGVRGYLIFRTAFHGVRYQPHWEISLGISIISIALLEFARFDMRRSMEEHFNGPEPIGLSLSGVMTFFFGVYYFQYHFTRINEIKRAARYAGAAV
ncbi:MAG TPA: GYF domain-containing protein [Acidobacteriaceae bacterium]|nr:GYF domain-containing protein [Acidobacteriaceae bacterium]